MSQDWIDDCMHFYGKVLTGKYAHWCPEWDELPIDETCEEFKVCTCFSGAPMTEELFDQKLGIIFNGVQEDKRSVARDDDSSNDAGYQKTIKELKNITSGVWDECKTNEEINEKLGRDAWQPKHK